MSDLDGLRPRHRPVNRAYLHHDVPALGPLGVAVTGITTKAKKAIGPDFLRHGILFHNPRPEITLRVFPLEGDPLQAGSGGIVVPPLGFFELYASTGGNMGEDWSRVRVNCGWQVVADEETLGGTHLTIWNYTDSVDTPVAPTANLLIDVGIESPLGKQWYGIRTRSTQILPKFVNRRGVLFHNLGPKAKAIAPGNIEASFDAGSVVLMPGATREFRAFGKVRYNNAFNAVTSDDSDGTLTGLLFV